MSDAKGRERDAEEARAGLRPDLTRSDTDAVESGASLEPAAESQTRRVPPALGSALSVLWWSDGESDGDDDVPVAVHNDERKTG